MRLSPCLSSSLNKSLLKVQLWFGVTVFCLRVFLLRYSSAVLVRVLRYICDIKKGKRKVRLIDDHVVVDILSSQSDMVYSYKSRDGRL